MSQIIKWARFGLGSGEVATLQKHAFSIPSYDSTGDYIYMTPWAMAADQGVVIRTKITAIGSSTGWIAVMLDAATAGFGVRLHSNGEDIYCACRDGAGTLTNAIYAHGSSLLNTAITICAYWTATHVYVSVNGSAWQSTAFAGGAPSGTPGDDFEIGVLQRAAPNTDTVQEGFELVALDRALVDDDRTTAPTAATLYTKYSADADLLRMLLPDPGLNTGAEIAATAILRNRRDRSTSATLARSDDGTVAGTPYTGTPPISAIAAAALAPVVGDAFNGTTDTANAETVKAGETTDVAHLIKVRTASGTGAKNFLGNSGTKYGIHISQFNGTMRADVLNNSTVLTGGIDSYASAYTSGTNIDRYVLVRVSGSTFQHVIWDETGSEIYDSSDTTTGAMGALASAQFGGNGISQVLNTGGRVYWLQIHPGAITKAEAAAIVTADVAGDEFEDLPSYASMRRAWTGPTRGAYDTVTGEMVQAVAGTTPIQIDDSLGATA